MQDRKFNKKFKITLKKMVVNAKIKIDKVNFKVKYVILFFSHVIMGRFLETNLTGQLVNSPINTKIM
jgi:hypothetical protein